MTLHPGAVTDDLARPATMARPAIALRPVLDVARRLAAGFEATAAPGHPAATVVSAALDVQATLPPNTFLTIAATPGDLADPAWLDALVRPGDLGGVVLHLDRPEHLASPARDHLRIAREHGALLSLGSADDEQPGLSTIADLRPAIVRLGRAWVRGTDVDAAKRDAVAATGHLAGQLDAWILADDVTTTAELVALAGLGVPLAQGPVIGGASWPWPMVSTEAHRALREITRLDLRAEGLRDLLQRAYTTRTTAYAVTEEAARSGYDLTVVLDYRGRPLTLLVLRDGTWTSEKPFRVNVDTTPEFALDRARHRRRSRRTSPIVCTDDAGRFCGILRVDRLAEHVATNRS